MRFDNSWTTCIDRTTIWGNPYSHLEGTLALYKVKTRIEAIDKYREYILDNPELLAKLPDFQSCKEKYLDAGANQNLVMVMF